MPIARPATPAAGFAATTGPATVPGLKPDAAVVRSSAAATVIAIISLVTVILCHASLLADARVTDRDVDGRAIPLGQLRIETEHAHRGTLELVRGELVLAAFAQRRFHAHPHL